MLLIKKNVTANVHGIKNKGINLTWLITNIERFKRNMLLDRENNNYPTPCTKSFL